MKNFKVYLSAFLILTVACTVRSCNDTYLRKRESVRRNLSNRIYEYNTDKEVEENSYFSK